MVSLFGIGVAGCASAAKFTPEQQQSIQAVAGILVKVAQETNTHAVARIRLVPAEFYAKQSFGMSGIEAELYLSANPADQDSLVTSTPMMVVQTSKGPAVVPVPKEEP